MYKGLNAVAILVVILEGFNNVTFVRQKKREKIVLGFVGRKT